MRATKGFTIEAIREIKNRKDAIRYCTQECPKHELGCAVDCELRKRFKIPPHGDKYPEE